MYCQKCGKSVGANADVCLSCGAELKYGKNDDKSFDAALVGFFLPFIGFIGFMLLYPFAPQMAKSAFGGALIGVCIRFLAIAVIVVVASINLGYVWVPIWELLG